MKRSSIVILIATLVGLIASSCNVTRRLPEGQYLLQKVKVEDDRTVKRK
jgi:hypothetical protein